MDNCKKEEKSEEQRTLSEARQNMARFLKGINATDKTAERIWNARIVFTKKVQYEHKELQLWQIPNI